MKLAFCVDSFALLKKKWACGFPSWGEIAQAAGRSGAGVLSARFDGQSPWTEQDLLELKRSIKMPLHVTASPTAECVASLAKIQPQLVLLAAAAASNGWAQELNLGKVQTEVHKAIGILSQKKIKSFLILGPDAGAIRLAKRLGVQGVALNSWPLSQAKGRAKREAVIEDLNIAGRLVRELGLDLHIAGEADYQTMEELSRIPEVSFLHIGYAVIARSFLAGLETAIEEILDEAPARSETQVAFEA